MENKRQITSEQLDKIVFEKSMQLLKESQAFKHLYSAIDDVDKGFIEVNEKRLETLQKEETKAQEKEDYVKFKEVKEEQLSSLGKLIEAYQKKVDLLKQIEAEVKKEIANVDKEGHSVFKGKEMVEFKHDEFPKGASLGIETSNTITIVKKTSDINNYQIQETNVDGLKPGDILKFEQNEIKLGGNLIVAAYRKIGDKFEEIKKGLQFTNIKKLLKNPK